MVIWTLISMSLAIKGGVDQIKEKAAIQILKKTFNRRRQTTVQGLENSKQLVSQKLNNSKGFPSQKNVLNKSIDINNSINNFKKNQSINNLVNDDNINEITNEEKSSVFVKMLTNYIQIVSSVATFNLSIPSGVFDFPQAAGQPLKQTMNSLDCALIEMNSNIPIIYLRFLFSLGLPISYLLLFLIGHYVYHLAKKSKIQWYILSTAAMFLIIYVQPDLVQQMISLMSCRRIGETDFILSNVSYECYTDEHKKYIAFLLAPFLIVWVFILPGILLIVLRNRKNILNDSSVQLKFGFLYKEYTNEAYYWEFVKMAEKIIIILCLNFYSQDVPVKATLVFIVITIYGVLSLIFKPYQEEEINQIDFYSTKVCAITVLLALFIYKNPFIYLQYLSLIIIIALNVWFLIKILKSLINVFWIKLSPMFQSILETLASKIPCLKKYAKKNKKVKPEVRERFRKIFKAFQNQPEEIKRKIVEKIQESYQKNKEIQQENKGIQQENKGNNKEEEKQLSTIKEKLSIGSLKEYPNPERNKDSCIVDSDMNSLQANKVKVLDKPIRTEIAINEEIIIFSDDNLVLQKSCESQRSKTENGLIEAPQIQLEMQNSNGIQQTFGQNG